MAHKTGHNRGVSPIPKPIKLQRRAKRAELKSQGFSPEEVRARFKELGLRRFQNVPEGFVPRPFGKPRGSGGQPRLQIPKEPDIGIFPPSQTSNRPPPNRFPGFDPGERRQNRFDDDFLSQFLSALSSQAPQPAQAPQAVGGQGSQIPVNQLLQLLLSLSGRRG